MEKEHGLRFGMSKTRPGEIFWRTEWEAELKFGAYKSSYNGTNMGGYGHDCDY